MAIVANPISGRGRGRAAAEALCAALARGGALPELLTTTARGDAGRLLSAAGPQDLVVAVGGDGTLSEVLAALGDARTPVGLLPTGTANVLAHELGLPREPERAAAVLLAGRVRELDVARVAGRLAHLVVGVGLDGRAVHELEARRRGPITKLTYVGATLRALRAHRSIPLRVELDGEPLHAQPGQVWIANTRRYADLLRLAPDGRLDDGLWEVYLFARGTPFALVAAGLRGLVAHLPGGSVSLRRARRVRIESDEPVPCQIDGDAGGTTPLTLELLPGRHRIVVP